ncbi:MAG: acyl-CoA thioesterase [Candidatus Marinimicrobia bacterium]|nr:acyl-CoA thioesterase [Candidatus Neomarinimicrobiota bacterium]
MNRFIYNYRVRYKDIDKMGVMYYSRYFEIFEEARTELLREIGLTYKELEEKGYYLPVVEAYCNYKRSAYYDDLLTVECFVAEFSIVKIRINYEVVRDKDLIGSGHTVHVFIDNNGKIKRPDKNTISILKLIVKNN